MELPLAMTLSDIDETINDFAKASLNAIKAGFDGVELHAANGYLIDQFLNSGSNTRDDEYGGSVVNRMRLLHEVVDAMSGELPRDRIGIRLSPSSSWMDMSDPDKEGLYSAVVRSLNGTGLSYIHLIEPEPDDP